MLQVFTEPIPRALWPNKPIGQPIRMYNLFEYGNPAGMTSSMPGQGWANLGLFGVLLWCGLFGTLWGWFYQQFARRQPSNVRLLVYMTFLPLSILFYRDGGPLTMLRFGLFLAIPLLVFSLFVRLSRVEHSQQAMVTGPSITGAQRRAQRAAAMSDGALGGGHENRRRRARQASDS